MPPPLQSPGDEHEMPSNSSLPPALRAAVPGISSAVPHVPVATCERNTVLASLFTVTDAPAWAAVARHNETTEMKVKILVELRDTMTPDK
jgi:hypothetical protein